MWKVEKRNGKREGKGTYRMRITFGQFLGRYLQAVLKGRGMLGFRALSQTPEFRKKRSRKEEKRRRIEEKRRRDERRRGERRNDKLRRGEERRR